MNWRLDFKGGSHVVLTPGGGHVATVYSSIRDGHVIAAAPDVLAALARLRKACNAVRPFAGVVAPLDADVRQGLDAVAFMGAIADADAAIAKAEGWK
jgi:hypothetical protein